MSLILSKQSGRGRAVLTKLPNPEAGVWNYSLTVVSIDSIIPGPAPCVK